MYNVSTEYKEQIQKQIRNPSFMRIDFSISNQDATDGAIITSTDGEPYSDTSVLLNNLDITKTYDTLELNRFVLDGDRLFLDVGPVTQQGFVSESKSIWDCTFPNEPKFRVEYDDYYELSGLTLRFDADQKDYCSIYRIELFQDTTPVFSKVVNNDEVNSVYEQGLPLHNIMEIAFIRTSLPYRKVRVNAINLGVTKRIEDDILLNATHDRKVDLLSTVLPKGDFKFKFLDVNRDYDPDNPVGVYSFLDELQPVKFQYGYELDDGTVEWVLGGSNYTTGEITLDSNGSLPNVTINTKNVINYLNEIYNSGVYSGTPRTLTSLATEVLDYTGFPYELDPSLDLYSTTTPIPRLPIREILQLIANAAMCVLDVDRNGVIKIYKPSTLVQLTDINDTVLTDINDENIFGILRVNESDFKFDFDNMLNAPIVDRYPPLRNVNTSFIGYVVDSNVSDLTKTTVSLVQATELFLPYDLATNVTLSTTGTLTITGTPEYYAYGCKLIISGSGDITVSGNKVIVNENNISIPFNFTGEDCDISNEFIVGEAHAVEYANWIGEVLLMKNQYTFLNRGFPELCPLDYINFETLYSNNINVTVIENKIMYDGGLSATTKVLV
jgi:hypothetical protein